MTDSDVVVMPVFLLTAGFILWMLLSESFRRSRLKLLLDYRLHLMSKVPNSDLAAVLEADRSGEFLSELEGGGTLGFARRIASAIHTGILLGSAAVASATLAVLNSFQIREAFTAISVVAAVFCLGFLISAAVSSRIDNRLRSPTSNSSPRPIA